MNTLVFQHLAVEHPDIFRDVWREAGRRLRAVALDVGAAIRVPGIQFHVEMTATTVAEWSVVRDYVASMAKAPGVGRARGLEAALAGHPPAFNAMARRLTDDPSGVIG